MIDKNVKIMDELMQAVAQTDEWNEIQKNDQGIKQADQRLFELLKGIVSDAQYMEIEGAVLSYANAISSAAMLYGMHVVEAIRDVSARPCDLSRHIMARTGRATV